MKTLKTLSALAMLVAVSKAVFCQGANPSDVGFVPAGIYQHTDIDSVNMENGNAVIHIPLFGYPQRGSALALNYSMIANTSLWQPNIQCQYDTEDEGGYCAYTYTMGNTPISGLPTDPYPCSFATNVSPAITYLQSATWCMSVVPTQTCHDTTFESGDQASPPICDYFMTDIFYVVEPTGEEHRLQYDASNLSLLRTTDGSGYRLQVNDPQPYYPYVPQGCSKGYCYYGDKDFSNSVLTNSKGINLSAHTLTDLNGNSIQGSSSGLIDTVGRVIPYPPPQATSTNTTGCPTLNAQYQSASGSATWTVPGPNGQPTTYLLCFATVAYQTDFWGYNLENATVTTMNADESETINTYSESYGTESVLQSVVLPDGNHWGFIYDAADPSAPLQNYYNSPPVSQTPSIGYGTLTKILTPEGSSISYQYNVTTDCGVYAEGEPIFVQYISQRSLTDASGNNSIWKYAIGYSVNGLTSVATDPYNNDTVYNYTNYGCDYLPTTTTHYAGSGTQSKVLRTENTTYQTVVSLPPTPYYSGQNMYANSFPATTTVIDEAGNQAQTTYSYDSGFTSAMPYCFLGQYTSPSDPIGPCTPYPVLTLGVSRGLQTSQKVYDYGGSPLATNTTSYAWQNGPNASFFYNMNLLTLPYQKSVYRDPSLTNLLAQTTYGYNTSGNQTSVSKLLTGSNTLLTTSIAYGNYGMPISVTDPLTYTTTTTYDSNDLFPYKVQRPTTANGMSHIDYYSYDSNTGNLLWHTDQNGSGPADSAHTTQYTYNDPFGRLTKVLNPPTQGGQGETDISYSDATPSPWTVTTTVHADPNPSQTSIKSYDSFGRLAQTTLPNGATQETNYDLMGRVQSVSNPHYGSPSPAPTAPTINYTFYTYDSLGRKTTQYQPDGTSHLQWAYSGYFTTITNENGISTQQKTDALGRLTQVVEPGGLTTQYSYDALSYLLSVNQLGNAANGDTPRTRSFSYDSLSRLLTATNPETGTIGYVYDADGNVYTRTDARGVKTTYSYDQLNRLLSKAYSDRTTPQSCYQYDSSSVTNGIGRLASAWTLSASAGITCPTTTPFLTKRSILAYDPMGRILQEQQYTPASQASGKTYAPQYNYDLVGNLTYSTDGVTPSPTPSTQPPSCAVPSPSWTTLTFANCFDGAGRLQTLVSNWVDSTHPQSLFASPSYAAFGGLLSATYGILPSGSNVYTQSRSFDNRLRTTGETDIAP
jgi:YD repeat-containing protein